MKRLLSVLAVMVVILLAFPLQASAEEEGSDEEYQAYLEEFNLDDMLDVLPDDTYDYLDDLGLTDFDYTNIIDISISRIFTVVEQMLLGVYVSPLRSALTVIAIILLTSILKGFQNSFNESSLGGVMSTVSALMIAAVLILRLSDCISNACSVIDLCASFSLVFIPIYALIIAVGGNPMAAVSYNTVMLGVTQAISSMANYILVPIVNIFLALGITNGIRPELNLGAITSFFKRNIILVISFIATIFMTVLTIRSNVSAAADTVLFKSVRFAVSSFVPVIGSAISDGLASITGYIGLIRSAVGVVGILAVILMFLPVILELLIWYISLGFCSMCSEMFNEKAVTSIVKAFQDTIIILLVILL
ncbi:MAG: stage III sporulation protein AE, partial [Clostridiales bacterium]|nr:stage III sporulation protein AE [Clostridiales bacterium]